MNSHFLNMQIPLKNNTQPNPKNLGKGKAVQASKKTQKPEKKVQKVKATQKGKKGKEYVI